MCCRRRQARNPLIVTAGRAIYNAYQDHQTTRQIQHTEMPPTHAAFNMQPHLDEINGEVLKGAGIDPPPYTPAVMNRAMISLDPPLYQATSRELRQDSSSDDETTERRVSNQTHSSSDNLPRIPNGVYHTKKELKAAYKTVRRNDRALYKAEKAVVNAERRSNKF